jgi:soluble lytic murein transglycosylase-like protein
LPVLAAAAVLALLIEAAGASQIYFYRDRRGVLHFTDAPTDVRFRPFRIKARVRAGAGSMRVDPKLLMPYITAAAQKYKLDPALVKAVIEVESAFDPYAVSWAGAQGLMQLMPATAALMEVQDSFSLKQNIFGGCRYLRLMLDTFGGNLDLALAAYNIGPDRVAREKKIPNVRETRLYVKKVLKYYKHYQIK